MEEATFEVYIETGHEEGTTIDSVSSTIQYMVRDAWQLWNDQEVKRAVWLRLSAEISGEFHEQFVKLIEGGVMFVELPAVPPCPICAENEEEEN